MFSNYKTSCIKNKYDPESVIFDDAIEFIKNFINCDEEDADKYRKAFANNDKIIIKVLINYRIKYYRFEEKLKC